MYLLFEIRNVSILVDHPQADFMVDLRILVKYWLGKLETIMI
jgi:hypothetical protein